VDMTARLLAARYGEPTGSPEWVTTLRSCSAHEAYLRTYRRAVDASLVIEFLLLDRLFPRSVFHALSTAELCIGALDPRPHGRVGFTDEAARVLGRARTRLEFRQVGELIPDLPKVVVTGTPGTSVPLFWSAPRVMVTVPTASATGSISTFQVPVTLGMKWQSVEVDLIGQLSPRSPLGR